MLLFFRGDLVGDYPSIKWLRVIAPLLYYTIENLSELSYSLPPIDSVLINSNSDKLRRESPAPLEFSDSGLR